MKIPDPILEWIPILEPVREPIPIPEPIRIPIPDPIPIPEIDSGLTMRMCDST